MLPVKSILPQITQTLPSQDVILVAPPGAGKSTFLPLTLLRLDCFTQQRIIMLQPRRVAVRAIAQYLAVQLGEEVGQTVGYRIRGERKVSAQTRLEIVTEGLLTRMIQSDPELKGVGLLIFDEFHERNLHADFALALSLEIQQSLRDNLRLLVMSATLDAASLSGLMPTAVQLRSEGRSFPVKISYRPFVAGKRLVDVICDTVLEAVATKDGNILVFLPGSWEIQTCRAQLADRLRDHTQVLALYGDLDKRQQMQAIAPTAGRKVVLATNIAETSLTIEGISLVIDSGLEKVAHFHLSRGITQLRQQMISQASSEQRAGRAGRLGPGHCYRLWSQEQQGRLRQHISSQILDADLVPLMLDAALWGARLEHLPLLDKPSQAQLAQARQLLCELEALDEQGRITPRGRSMVDLGCHPRLANMLLRAKALGEGASLACLLACLLESQAKIKGVSGAQLHGRVQSLLSQPAHPLWQQARQWARRLKVTMVLTDLHGSLDLIPVLVGFAFPDWLAKHRGKGRYLLMGGSGASLAADDPLSQPAWLAVGGLLLGQSADARITLAEPIQPDQIQTYFQNLISEQHCLEWHEGEQRILSEKRRLLGAIQLDARPSTDLDDQACQALWCKQIRRKGLAWLNWDKGLWHWLEKLSLARRLLGDNWPDMSETWLLDNLEAWLGPYLSGVKDLKQLKALDWAGIVKAKLDWEQQQSLAQLLPDRLKVPSGRVHKLRYEADGSVILAVKIQEVYGLTQTPTVANGRLAVQMDLLSPAGRPLQRTRDLAGFWAGSYKQVQKEMKGRYPKHFWPDDPAKAIASTKSKKQMGL